MKKLFTIWTILTILILLLFLNSFTNAQLSSPTTETVYGGRINGISVISTAANTSRIYIATESANSVFYADVTTTSGSESFGTFTVMPGLGSDDNYGSAISKIYAHQTSGYLFFLQNNNLYKTIYTGSAVTLVEGAAVSDFIVYGDYIFYIKGTLFYYGQIDGSGNITSSGSFSIASLTFPSIRVNPSDSKIYIATLSTTPSIYESSQAYNALTGSSSFSALTVGTISASFTSVDAFGIGPDGTFFIGGDNNSYKFVQYSTDKGATWSATAATSITGIGGTNFSFAGSTSPYVVHTAKCYATFTTASGFGSWAEYGNVSSETHPNDGAVFVDPNNNQIVYITTDQGIGATKNGGSVLFEIDDGVEAVQVNDFSMHSGKDIAWLASKAGVRKVTSFSTTPVWTNAIFPNNDGSTYYSAEMENDNDATAYVGNVRVYKTNNSGSSWNRVLSESTTGYPGVGSRVEAIEVCPTNSNLVLAGFYVDGTNQGGLWYSINAGAVWTQLKLRSTSTLPNDVDVKDIAFTTESGHAIAYIGVYYDLTISGPENRGYSIYRAEWDGSAWTVREDMQYLYTSTGAVIVVTINDIEVNSAGTILYATGTDASLVAPVAYYKDLSGTNKWTPVPPTGFPTGDKQGKAIAVGGGAIYCAVDNVIYTIAESGGTEWSIGHTYPAGTEINVLFYDALLAGTGTGLYGHDYSGPLPVELISFTAELEGKKVNLNWETATEVNNYGFAVERSAVGGQLSAESGKRKADSWQRIGFVQGHGNSNSPKEYSFVDEPSGGKEFSYRLRQIDFDGAYEFSHTVKVSFTDELNFNLVQNFPNPFNPETVIKFELPKASFVKLRVYNTLGEEVGNLLNEKKDAGIYSVDFNAKHLPSGVYLYRLETNGYTQTKKMLLVK